MKNQNPIKLNSSAPLDDGGRQYNKLYFIFAIIGALIGLAMNGFSAGIVAALFAMCIAYAVKSGIVDWKWKHLRRLKFQLDTLLPYDELISRLIPILTPLGMMIEKNQNGQPVITYEHMIYDISLSQDNTFSIWWRKSPIRALAPKGALSYYRQTVIAMGIIGYHIQQICAEKNDGESISSTSTNQNMNVKFCTECGAKCNCDDKFCTNCGHSF